MLIKTCDNKIKKAHLQRQKKNGKKQTNIQIVRRENAKNRGFLRLREIWKQGKKEREGETMMAAGRKNDTFRLDVKKATQGGRAMTNHRSD